MKGCEGPVPRKRKSKRKTKEVQDGVQPDLHPLSYYVSEGNKTELLDHAFQSVDEEIVQSLLLPTLQGKSTDELKQICQKQLDKLSNNEILSLLASVSHHQGSSGQQQLDPAIQDDHTRTAGHLFPQDSDQDGNSKLQGKTEEQFPKTTIDVSLLQDSADVDMEVLTSVEKKTPETAAEMSPSLNVDETSTGESWLESKTERDIMELEFRARAIRSLMRSQGLVTIDEESTDDSKLQSSGAS